MTELPLTDMERQLLVVLVTKQWVEIRDDPDMDRQVDELLSIMRKINGVDVQLIARNPDPPRYLVG
ncbi:hypothetical protein IVA80_15390 [Bradyrhizobium sp. 139]|uniref:hypothetical protein n=1 Tax=Bradyrhizobium sp. 139 TaxID=2782616 RepID=UPI001FFBB709|nr:hypothetical protein [Bradyrhizobium sp. 139]MCK1742208.1 hypothetical protein [Bradyrhizobium sp. 139]